MLSFPIVSNHFYTQVSYNFYLSSDCNPHVTVKNAMTEKVGFVHFKWVIFLPKSIVPKLEVKTGLLEVKAGLSVK